MANITIDTRDKNIYEIVDWCNKMYGVSGWNFESLFPTTRYRFFLPDNIPESLTWFRLRWR